MQDYVYYAIAYNIFMVGTGLLFWAYSDRDFMRRRNPKVVLLMSFAACWNGLNLWKQYWPFPCYVRILQRYSGGPLYIFGMLLRVLFLIQLEAVEKLKSDSAANLDQIEIAVLRLFAVGTSKVNYRYPRMVPEKKSFALQSSLRSPSTNFQKQLESIKFSNYIQIKALVIILGVFIFFEAVVLSVVYGSWQMYLTTPNCVPAQNTLRVVIEMSMIVFIMISLLKIINVNDSVHLKTEITFTALVSFVCFANYIIQNYADTNAPFYWKMFGPSIFNLFMYIINQVVMAIFPITMAILISRRAEVKSRSLNAVHHTNEDLLNVLRDSVECKLFLDILKTQYRSEWYQFYTKTLNVSIQARGNGDPSKEKKAIRVLHANFISDDSPFQLDLSNAIKQQINEAIASGKFTIKDLNPIIEEVLNKMRLETLPLYLKTKSKKDNKSGVLLPFSK